MPESVPQAPFSVDYLVTEVNTIVEDLRWLHFELKLRNNLNELLFHEVGSVEEFLKLGFSGFRSKMSILEVTIYLRSRVGYSIGFRDLEDSVFWADDPVPWTSNLEQMFRQRFHREEPPQPSVSHYTVNNDPITSIAMPVVINREVVAVISTVAHTSNLIPRYKKLLSGLSVALSVSVHYIKNIRRMFKSTDGSVKYADNTLPYDDALRLIETVTLPLHGFALVLDSLNNILVWSSGAEEITGIGDEDVNTFHDVVHVFSEDGGSGFVSAIKSGVPFEDLTVPLLHVDGNRRPFLWSMRKVGTSKGVLLVLTGSELPATEGITSGALQSSMQPLWLHQAFTDIESVYIAVLDPDFNIVYMNPQLNKRLGFDFRAGENFIQRFVPRHEHGYVESALRNYFGAKGVRQSHEQFHLITSEEETLPLDWHLGMLPATRNTPASLWLFGSVVPDELFQVTKDLELRQFPYKSPEAKLSKHYRFLMKYVPFPIIHLDEDEDVIRNTNLAFEQIIGTRDWEGAPVSDFGSLEIQGGVGDARPCTLYLLNPEGITLTHRGIITPLQIFGKRIREIKLDPLD